MRQLVVGSSSTAAAADPPCRSVRIALTGCGGTALQRYRAAASVLGVEVENGQVISSAVTHVVVYPAVGAKRTAKSIWAALSKKTLVSPAWLEASSQQGRLLPLEPAPAPARAAATPAATPAASAAAASSVSSAPPMPPPQAVRGVANPLDGLRVHVTAAFRAQHRASAIVGALLTEQAYLLGAATIVAAADEAAHVVFVADGEEERRLAERPPPKICELFPCPPRAPPMVLTWECFLERLVPGHSRTFLQRRGTERVV